MNVLTQRPTGRILWRRYDGSDGGPRRASFWWRLQDTDFWEMEYVCRVEAVVEGIR